MTIVPSVIITFCSNPVYISDLGKRLKVLVNLLPSCGRQDIFFCGIIEQTGEISGVHFRRQPLASEQGEDPEAAANQKHFPEVYQNHPLVLECFRLSSSLVSLAAV